MNTIPAPNVYQSRTGTEAAILSRPDPVVYAGGDPRREDVLTPQQLSRYRKKGFMVLPKLFSADEIARFMQEGQRLSQDAQIREREECIIEQRGTEVRSIFRVHRLSALFERLVADPRVANVARQILGSEVYIHQSRLNFKPGFGGGDFYWHSDFETWHIEDGMPRMRALSCSVLLTDNSEFNAPLMVIPGSHKYYISCVGETPAEHYKQSLKAQQYGVPDQVSLKFLADQGGMQALKGAAGSVIFFDCNTMHGSNSNISPYPRSNLFFVYNSVDNTLEQPRSGLPPRPEFIAARTDIAPVAPAAPSVALIH